MRLNLQIGGYTIQLDECEDHPCQHWPLKPFKSFLLTSDEPPDLDVTVKVVKQLPDIPHENLIFDACHGLWKLYQSRSGYVLESANTHSLAPLTRSIVSSDFSQVEAWICAQYTQGKNRRWKPMHIINPLVEVCLVTKLAREGGLLLHAAGVLTKHQAWVFTGASGSGKSTLSDLFAARGACVLSDERIIIRKVADAFVVYGTPWVGISRHAQNQTGLLYGLCCIRHGQDTHALRRLSSRDTSLFILRQCFLPHWDRVAMDRALAFINELVEQIDCRELAFVRNPDIVDYLEGQSLTCPAVLS